MVVGLWSLATVLILLGSAGCLYQVCKSHVEHCLEQRSFSRFASWYTVWAASWVGVIILVQARMPDGLPWDKTLLTALLLVVPIVVVPLWSWSWWHRTGRWECVPSVKAVLAEYRELQASYPQEYGEVKTEYQAARHKAIRQAKAEANGRSPDTGPDGDRGGDVLVPAMKMGAVLSSVCMVVGVVDFPHSGFSMFAAGCLVLAVVCLLLIWHGVRDLNRRLSGIEKDKRPVHPRHRLAAGGVAVSAMSVLATALVMVFHPFTEVESAAEPFVYLDAHAVPREPNYVPVLNRQVNVVWEESGWDTDGMDAQHTSVAAQTAEPVAAVLEPDLEQGVQDGAGRVDTHAPDFEIGDGAVDSDDPEGIVRTAMNAVDPEVLRWEASIAALPMDKHPLPAIPDSVEVAIPISERAARSGRWSLVVPDEWELVSRLVPMGFRPLAAVPVVDVEETPVVSAQAAGETLETIPCRGISVLQPVAPADTGDIAVDMPDSQPPVAVPDPIAPLFMDMGLNTVPPGVKGNHHLWMDADWGLPVPKPPSSDVQAKTTDRTEAVTVERVERASGWAPQFDMTLPPMVDALTVPPPELDMDDGPADATAQNLAAMAMAASVFKEEVAAAITEPAEIIRTDAVTVHAAPARDTVEAMIGAVFGARQWSAPAGFERDEVGRRLWLGSVVKVVARAPEGNEWLQLDTGLWVDADHVVNVPVDLPVASTSAFKRIVKAAPAAIVKMPVAPVAVVHSPVTNATTHVRTGPGMNFALASWFGVGMPVQPTARTESGDWLQLDSGFWVQSSLIDHIPDNLPVENVSVIPAVLLNVEPVPLQRKAVAPAVAPSPAVNTNSNLRAGPGTEYAITGWLNSGAVVTPVARNHAGNWLLLNSGHWIWGDLVDRTPSVLPLADYIPPVPVRIVPAPAAPIQVPVPAPAPHPATQAYSSGRVPAPHPNQPARPAVGTGVEIALPQVHSTSMPVLGSNPTCEDFSSRAQYEAFYAGRAKPQRHDRDKDGWYCEDLGPQ